MARPRALIGLEAHAKTLEHELTEAGPNAAAIKWPSVVKGEIFRFVVTADNKILLNELEPARRFAGGVSIDRDEMAAYFVDGDEQDSGIIGYGSKMPDGAYIFVGQEDEHITDLRDALVESILVASALAFAVSVAWGFLVAIRSYRRIEQLNDVAARVKGGDMTRRMPISRRGDEIDLLSAQLNHMFDRLEQMMDAIKQVSSDIAHDLRTPLTRLQQQLDDIRAARSDAERLDHIDRAFDEAQQMREIFGSMLRISQLEGRAAQSGFASVDLTELLRDLVDTYEPVFEDGGRKLRNDIAADVTLFGDAGLLRQLFSNLLENIIAHTPEGTTAQISLRSTGEGAWQAIVEDDGPGISGEHRPHIFKRFYRVDKSRTLAGSGLGLALVKAIADAHDLAVDIVDRGTGFALSIRPEQAGPATMS